MSSYKNCCRYTTFYRGISKHPTIITTPDGEFTFVLEQGDNYGSAHGVFYGSGNRNNAVFSASRKCYSGRELDYNDINPEDNNVAMYDCDN